MTNLNVLIEKELQESKSYQHVWTITRRVAPDAPHARGRGGLHPWPGEL